MRRIAMCLRQNHGTDSAGAVIAERLYFLLNPRPFSALAANLYFLYVHTASGTGLTGWRGMPTMMHGRCGD